MRCQIGFACTCNDEIRPNFIDFNCLLVFGIRFGHRLLCGNQLAFFSLRGLRHRSLCDCFFLPPGKNDDNKNQDQETESDQQQRCGIHKRFLLFCQSCIIWQLFGGSQFGVLPFFFKLLDLFFLFGFLLFTLYLESACRKRHFLQINPVAAHLVQFSGIKGNVR